MDTKFSCLVSLPHQPSTVVSLEIQPCIGFLFCFVFFFSFVILPNKVNGTSLLGATHLEAVRSLRGIGENLSLLVCDGFDPSEIPAGQSWMASPAASINSGRTQSEESLDREPMIPTNERAYEDIKKEIKRQVCLCSQFLCLSVPEKMTSYWFCNQFQSSL